MDEKAYAELKTYLRRLGWALAVLPERDRDDIVEETRVHVLARTDQGQTLSHALAALGPAESYARRFIDEMEISDALASQRPLRVLSVVLRRMHRSFTAGVACLAVLILVAFAICGVTVAVVKPFNPDHTGLLISTHGGFIFGSQFDGRGDMREVLGLWLYPFVIFDLAVVWFATRLILLGAVRTLARKD